MIAAASAPPAVRFPYCTDRAAIALQFAYGAKPGNHIRDQNMRKMSIVAAFLAAMAVAAPAQADLSPNVFRKLSSGSKTDRSMVEMYVGGVVKGYLSANGYLASANQPMLFCYGGDYTTGQAMSLATQVVNEHMAKNLGDGDREIMEVLLLIRLQAMHPCSKAS